MSFYSVQILSKGGPLQVIWMAAHMDRQLKRQQVFDTSIVQSVNAIMQPQDSMARGEAAPLALRLSGQLLLGIVKVYARKVKYLQQDLDDAIVKMGDVLDAPRGRGGTAGTSAERGQAEGGGADAGGEGDASGAGGRQRAASAAGLSDDVSGFVVDDDEALFASQAGEGGDDSGGTAPGASSAFGATPTRGDAGHSPLPLLMSRQGGAMSASPHTPAGTFGAHAKSALGGAPSSGGLGSRLGSLSGAGSLAGLATTHAYGHAGDDDEEMFEAVPEHFDFDLGEEQIAELTVPSVLPDSQQMSNLQSGAAAVAAAAAAVHAGALPPPSLLTPGGAHDDADDAFEYHGELGAAVGASQTGGKAPGPLPTPPPPPPRPPATEGMGEGARGGTVVAPAVAAAAPVTPGQHATAAQRAPAASPDGAAPHAADAAVAAASARAAKAAAASAPAAVLSAGTRLSLSRAPPVVDTLMTTLTNAEYRAYLMDRTSLLRRGTQRPQVLPPPPQLGFRCSGAREAGMLGGGGGGQAHPELRALFATIASGGESRTTTPGGPADARRTTARTAGARLALDTTAAWDRNPLGDKAGPASDSPGDGTLPSGTASGTASGPSGMASASSIDASSDGDGGMVRATTADGASDSPDPYLEDGLDVFEESRRELDEDEATATATAGDRHDSTPLSGLSSGTSGAACDGDSGVGDGSEGGDDAGFTARTRALAKQLQWLLGCGDGAPPPPKRLRLEAAAGGGGQLQAGSAVPAQRGQCGGGGGGTGAAPAELLMSDVLETAGSRGLMTKHGAFGPTGAVARRHAVQTFYDLLVLQNRGYVRLSQDVAYGELSIAPRGPLHNKA